MTYTATAELFGVGRASVSRLLRRHRETGNVEAKPLEHDARADTGEAPIWGYHYFGTTACALLRLGYISAMYPHRSHLVWFVSLMMLAPLIGCESDLGGGNRTLDQDSDADKDSGPRYDPPPPSPRDAGSSLPDAGDPRVDAGFDAGQPDSGKPPPPHGPRWYCPTDNLTRAAAATLLLRTAKGRDYSPPPAQGIFKDVPASSFHAPYIEQMYRLGSTSGCRTDYYCPRDPVTRAQFAVFLIRTLYGTDFKPAAPTGLFNDVPVSAWYAAYAEQLKRDGITSGCRTGYFCPHDATRRDQAATFIMRARWGSSFDPPAAEGIFEDVAASSVHAQAIEFLFHRGVINGCR